MSVYTPVTAEELDAWLARYSVGRPGRARSRSRRASRTRTTSSRPANGRYVLTLYERLPADRAAVLPEPDGAPRPRRRRSARPRCRTATGSLFSLLNGKPAGLVDALRRRAGARARRRPLRRRRRGARPAARRVARVPCAAHQSPRSGLVAAGGASGQPVPRRRTRTRCSPRSSSTCTGLRQGPMPRGAVHGDLFCDNVLFAGAAVAGIIDFGFAATDFLAYDLAIAVNDWCIVRDGARDRGAGARAGRCVRPRLRPARPLTADEREQWPSLLRAARCASGCPGCTTCTCRAPASSSTRTTRRTSSASCATVSPDPRGCRWRRRCRRGRGGAGEAVTDATPAPLASGAAAARGVHWLRDAYARLSRPAAALAAAAAALLPAARTRRSGALRRRRSSRRC